MPETSTAAASTATPSGTIAPLTAGTDAAPPADLGYRQLHVRVNGADRRFLLGYDVRPADTLASLLREKLGLTGLKVSCDAGACGACTVLLDGRAVLSCMVLAGDAHGHEVVTIEGLPSDHPVVVAFAEQSAPGHGTALQCGYCTPGFVMATIGFLARTPDPTPAEIREGLSNNLCRCGCYNAIVPAVLHAVELLRAWPGTLIPGGDPR
jgi:aerobic carbon-monoxide dehydrogenase small subunit